MYSSMAFLRKKFIWSNHLNLLLIGREYGKAYGLQKSLYGLKYSPKPGLDGLTLWYMSLASQKDHSIFFHINQGKHFLTVIYVDDIVITRDDVHDISDLKLHLQQKF